MPEGLSRQPVVYTPAPAPLPHWRPAPGPARGRGRPEANRAVQHRHGAVAGRVAVSRRGCRRCCKFSRVGHGAVGRRRPRRAIGTRGAVRRAKPVSASPKSATSSMSCWRPTSTTITPHRPGRTGPRGAHLFVADGAMLHEIRKHTDWITAIEYSPDGVLLATAIATAACLCLGSRDGPRVSEPEGAHWRHHRRQLADRFESAGQGQRGWHDQAVGDGKRPAGKNWNAHRRRRRRRSASPPMAGSSRPVAIGKSNSGIVPAPRRGLGAIC